MDIVEKLKMGTSYGIIKFVLWMIILYYQYNIILIYYLFYSFILK